MFAIIVIGFLKEKNSMLESILKSGNYSNVAIWIDFAISILVIAFLLYVTINSAKRTIFTIVSIIAAVVSLIAWFLAFHFLWALSIVCMTSFLAATIVLNQSELKELFTSFGRKKMSKSAQKVYDRHAVCQKVAIAVETLSKSKTGALITFEKNVLFSDIVKSGTILNAPITPELLVTIFYPGTRLHDGAVVIRRDQILAASVYYTPTTKPLTGKFGSRHRAAIGISEITDSVTVVVSEETGRVSLAYHGELIPVPPDSFLRTVEEYLFTEEKQEGEEKK